MIVCFMMLNALLKLIIALKMHCVSANNIIFAQNKYYGTII